MSIVALTLVLIGAWRMVLVMAPAMRSAPWSTALAIVLFAGYALPFLLLVRWLDFLDPLPLDLWFLTLLCGALVSANLAIPANALAVKAFATVTSAEFAARWSIVFVSPTVEGASKTMIMFLIILVVGRRLHSVVDGFVLGALVGVGFQFTENVLFAVNAVTTSGRGDVLGPVLETFLIRGFLAGFWSHPIFAAIEFAGFAYFFVRTRQPVWIRLGVVVAAQVLGWSLHALWNLPWALGWYNNLGVITTTITKGAAVLTAFLVLLHLAQRRQARQLVGRVETLADPAIATPAELAALASVRLRIAARNYAAHQAGYPGREAVREIQRAQARLAVALARHPELIEPDRREILTARGRMRALGLTEAVDRSQPLPWWAWEAAGAGALVIALFVADWAHTFYGG